MITSFCFTNFKVEAKTVTSGRLSASVSGTIYTGSKAAITNKYTKKKITKGSYIISTPIAYKNGYKFQGWYNGKSKYGIHLSSYREALDFYLGCGRDNDDNATYKCIHNGGKFDDTFTDTEYDYYPNVYERYVPMGDNYAMLCGECGKYFYGPTKHDDWDIHMFYICNVLSQPGSGWSWAWDTYDIFYKKEGHEHTDTMRRSYCQNKGKKYQKYYLKVNIHHIELTYR